MLKIMFGILCQCHLVGLNTRNEPDNTGSLATATQYSQDLVLVTFSF